MKTATGKVIKAFRNYLNFTQKQVADKLNITVETLANIENGRAGLDIEKLSLLSKVFGVPARILLDLTLGINAKGSDEGLANAVRQLKTIPIDHLED